MIGTCTYAINIIFEIFRVYKTEHRPTIWKCFFECYHDDKCDYFVDVHSYCCYGDFQHTGSPAVTWSNDVTVYVKNGKSIFQIEMNFILVKTRPYMSRFAQTCP